MITLFFNTAGMPTGSEMKRSRWMKYNETAGELSFTFHIPAGSTLYLLCLWLHTGSNGVPANGMIRPIMQIIMNGEC